MPGDFDFGFNTESSIMDFDVDNHGRISNSALSSLPNAKKLEFVDIDSEALGLSGLDISFDAQASEDGKIRVRIHPPASTTVTAAPSPSASGSSDGDEQSMWGGSEVSGPTSSAPSSQDSAMSSSVGTPSSVDSDPLGPFLGMGGLDKGDMDFMSHLSGGSSLDISSDTRSASPMGGLAYPSDSTFDFGVASGFGASPDSSASAGRRRVRIALKSLPGQGHEGGEWEVQVC